MNSKSLKAKLGGLWKIFNKIKTDTRQYNSDRSAKTTTNGKHYIQIT